jgi:DNA invertase Pin-like site-specific DNA recombinase
MRPDPHQKVTSRHLTRNAYLYIRQSTLHQVIHHKEGARRQYDLQERAIALGWTQEQIVVIDMDQGQSGSTADRLGFQQLITEVGLGHAGLVMGLEVSRLARNSADWHRLLEICALSDTLILDEDGLYEPGHFNDRLLLGLKGTMSEAELHVMRARLQGGLLSKARRGELRIPLPIGFVYDDQSQVTLDPDRQVQEAVRNLFSSFLRVGSALGTAKHFVKEGLLFPCRPPVRGPRDKAPLQWKDLDVSTVLRMLQNPRYAGIYCFGKTRQYKNSEGRHVCLKLSKEDWFVWIPDAHAGYISQQEHEENLRRLAENARAIGAHRRSPPREGQALLQGLVLCGKCGRRMHVHYHRRREEMVPSYVCSRKEKGACQTLHGKTLDEAIGELLVELMSPMTLEVSLSVQQELEQRFEQAEQLRRKQVDRARYEADLARQRFLLVDPNNRMVAATLEGEWNEKLRLLTAAEEEFERRRAEDRKRLDDKQKSAIRSLAGDFSRLWKDPGTSARERKRIARLLIEDVTLQREDRQITAHIRFKAGATRTLTVTSPQAAPERFKTPQELVQEVDRLLDHHPEEEISEMLNDRGLTPPRSESFTPSTISSIRIRYKLKTRRRRLRDRGYLTEIKLASKLRVGTKTLKLWERHGFLRLHHCGRLRFYEDPVTTTATPEEVRDQLRAAFSELSTQPATNEVQYEA